MDQLTHRPPDAESFSANEQAPSEGAGEHFTRGVGGVAVLEVSGFDNRLPSSPESGYLGADSPSDSSEESEANPPGLERILNEVTNPSQRREFDNKV